MTERGLRSAHVAEGNTAPQPTGGLSLEPLKTALPLPDLAYHELKRAIMAMRIYDGHQDLRLDERGLALDLGISRTPVREALSRLQHEGLVRTVPRRGVFVVRKRKAEIIEIIVASAALEGVAARLAASRASDEQIANLRQRFTSVITNPTHLDSEKYSAINLQFHQTIVDLSQSELLSELVGSLKIHMRAIRAKTMGESDRLARSPIEHLNIVEALQARDADALEGHVRQHGYNLADHVEHYVDYLD